MCGIIGIVSKTEVLEKLIKGLKQLEYRGYDSSGVVTTTANSFCRRRSSGKLLNLKKRLKVKPISGTIGIGHTRWATHGKPTEKNAHPHLTDNVGLVHNGIIENYSELKESLKLKQVKFSSETDTEVITKLVEIELTENGLSPEEAVKVTLKKLQGSFSLCFIFRGFDNLLIATKRGSPLALGYGKNEMFVGSDANSLSLFTRKIVYLEEGDFAIIKREKVSILDYNDNEISRKIVKVSADAGVLSKGSYKHFMQKEIFEQPAVISQVLGYYLNASEQKLTLQKYPSVKKTSRIILIGCGTAYYASLVGRYWIEKISGIPCNVELASEFRYREPIVKYNDLVLVVSQSGETADSLGALRHAKKFCKNICAIVNVEESSIARESSWVFPIKAGPEIGVASTKAFVSQLLVLMFLNMAFAEELNRLNKNNKRKLFKGLIELPRIFAEILSKTKNQKKLSKKLSTCKSVLFLGRDLLYPIALEGALKLKEITYIHSEGYASGELKHGPIALIDKDMHVIAINPKTDVFEKVTSNLEEVKARKGKLVLFTDKVGRSESGNLTKAIFELPTCASLLEPIVYSLPLQLLAYFTALDKGTDVDQPRNLAKSVTVE